MVDLLLRPNRRLEGPRRVDATVRPLRLAYLVPPDDTGTALAAIDACCLLLGGALQFLIPCPPGGAPDAFWTDVLERHDPDELVDLVGAAEVFCDRQRKHRLRRVERWERPTETMQLRGALLTSTIKASADRGRWDTGRLVRNVHPLFGHPWALPVAFGHGHLERRPMDRHSPLRREYVATRLEDLAQLWTVDPWTLDEDELLRLVTERPLAPSTPERPGALGPPALTPLDLATQLPVGTVSTKHGRFRPQIEVEWRHADPYDHHIVVVGPYESVPDLCLAWDLRAQRPWDALFPIWVRLEQLADPVVRDRLQAARREDRAVLDAHPGRRWLGLVSATLSEAQMAALASDLPDAVAHGRDDLRVVFPDAFQSGLTRRSTAVFSQGIADVALPDLAELGAFGSGETLGVTVAVPGWTLPRMPEPRFRSSSYDMARIAVDGFSGTVSLGRIERPDFVTVDSRNGKEALDAIAQRAGYAARVSDKGRQGIAVMELFGTNVSLPLLASSRVYELLREMARIVSRQVVQRTLTDVLPGVGSEASVEAVVGALQQHMATAGQFVRPHLTFGQLENRLGVAPEDAVWIVRQFVQCRVLLRGYEVACPACGLRRWHSVDRLGETYRCDGCRASSPLPLPVDKPLGWLYRLNETVAQAVDQGVLPHLQAVLRIVPQGPRDGLLGLLPGVDFLPLPDEAGAGRKACEVDVLAIVDGRPVICECKATGARLTEKDVDQLLRLAEYLDEPTVVLATPTDFAEVADVVEAARSRLGQRLDLWEAPDMLDPSGHPAVPQNGPIHYLNDLVRWQQRRDER